MQHIEEIAPTRVRYVYQFFFFSSRRRHTRCGRDWSSDVCSSDLVALAMLMAPLKRLTNVNEVMQRGLAAAESVFGLIDEQPEADRGTLDLGRARGEIEFQRVGFVYAGATHPALQDITLRVAAGETVALVGASGSGKTT